MRAGRDDARRRALRDALQVVLPTALETDLLRVVLWQGEPGSEAWRRWRERAGDPLLAFERLHAGLKGLAPLLYVAARRNRLEIPQAFGSYLRAAYFREELRGNAYRRILSDVLRGLAAAELRPLVLKGEALAATVYDDPKTRHSHGIELLVRRAQGARAAAILPALNFRPARRRGLSGAGHASWRHGSGLPLELRTRLFGPEVYAVADEALWSRSVDLRLGNTAAQALGREHALLHVCASAAMSASRSTLRWACDGWLLLRSRPEAFDWPLLVDAVAAARLALPLAIMLRFLAEALAAPVPDSVLRQLEAKGGQSDDFEYELALLCALPGVHDGLRRTLLAASGWSNRAAVLRALVAPSPAALRALDGDLPAAFLPLYYAGRPARYLARRLWRQRPAWAMRP